MQDADLFVALAGIAGVFVGFAALIAVRSGGSAGRPQRCTKSSRYEPDRLAAWKALSGPLPLTFSRAFEPVESGTRVTMRYQMEERALLRLAAPLLARMGRRQLEGDYPKLKQLLEQAS